MNLEELKKIFDNHSQEFSKSNPREFNLPLALAAITQEIMSLKKILQENIYK